MYTNGNSSRHKGLNGRSPRQMMCRGVRGAVTAKANTEEAILAATRELIEAMVRTNGIESEDVASVYLTTTRDLNATYPALAARQLGWLDVPLLCGHEMDVPNGLAQCVRVLIHWNTTRTQSEISHIYLREAKSLRPDRQNVQLVRPIQVDQIQAAVRVLAG